MTDELEQVATVPHVWAVRIYEEGRSSTTFDHYFNACIAVLQPDGIPEVQCFALPMEDEKENPDAKRVNRQRCHEVRVALGDAFAKIGWHSYYRVLPGSGKKCKRPVMGDDCHQ